MHRHHPGRRVLNRAKQGLHLLERGLTTYHGLKAAYGTVSAFAEAAAPYVAGVAAAAAV